MTAKVRAGGAYGRGTEDAIQGALGALELELWTINDKHITGDARSDLLDLLARLRDSL